jgi:hypothetical protein
MKVTHLPIEPLGPYWWSYWAMMFCNLSYHHKYSGLEKEEMYGLLLLSMSILINIGMWFERFVIIVTSLHRDYLPSSWVYYSPTWVEVGIFVGSIGVFMTLFLLFCRFFPAIAIAEVKSILKVSGNQYRQKQLEEVKDQEVYKNYQ